jgi:hypothetical protein
MANVSDLMLKDIKVSGRVLFMDLWYPRVGDNVNEIQLGLMDVRASDGIRISYDHDRDGWVIKQGSVWEFPAEGPCDEDWQEVTFIQSWARDSRREEESGN